MNTPISSNTSARNSVIRMLLAALSLLAPAGLRATPTENLGLRVLPAPGKITVDGKADDWDLSGGIFACDDVEEQRERFAVWLHAQYDAENFHLLARWIDDTPLNNPGQTIADYGFAGDSLQFRTLTAPGTPQERGQHFTAWRGRDGADVIKIEQGRNFKEGVVVDAKKTDGARQAFTVNADGRGYVQEISIPWKLLSRDGQPLKAGDSFTLTFEPNFTIGTKGRASVKDLFKPGAPPDRVFTFMASQCWGAARIEAIRDGKPQPVRLADAREFPVKLENGTPVVDWTGLVQTKQLPGFKPIAFTMAADGYISLNIHAADGTVVRQLLNAAHFTKGSHTVQWDGLTNRSWTRPGEPVPPGEYHWSALTHAGLGLKLRGWAANGGTAPWSSADGKGNWGGDHGLPSAVATDETQVYLGWDGAEAGRSVLACDLEGRVQWGNNRGGIAGVKSLAAHDGVLYILGGLSGPAAEGGNIYKLSTKDGSYLKWEGSDSADIKVKALWPADAKVRPEKADYIRVEGGQIHLVFRQDKIAAVLDPRGGRLVSISILDRADNPLVRTKGGSLYWATSEPDNQILPIHGKGREDSIGRKGGRPLLGPWQPDGMRHVRDFAVDAAGKLWVVESDGAPKRMSVWDLKTGKFVREFFGPSSYGALGGAINPFDPDIMVGQGCEWRLDPKTGQAKCLGVITRDGMENAQFGIGPNGRQYLVVATRWTFDIGDVNIFERIGDGGYKLRTKIFYTDADGKDIPPPAHGQTGNAARTAVWSDENGDGLRQPGEVTMVDGIIRVTGWYMPVTPDLTLRSGENRFPVTGFTGCGAPRYDFAHPVKMPIAGWASTDGKFALANGQYGVTHGTNTCIEIATGKVLWTYPDNFTGVHGSHNACPPEAGMIRGSFGPCGTAKLPAPLGNIWVIPTNVGEWHILTEGGFYLSRLFEGDPLKVKWPPLAVPGADMTQTPPGMGGEDFGGNIALGKDGKLYVQAGKTAFWNLEVTGLDTVKAIAGGALKISGQDVALARKSRDQQMQASVGTRRMAVKKATPKFSGSLDADFKGAEIALFEKQEETKVRAAAAWDEQNLYLAWDVRDKTPWINGADTPESLYLGGDTVDFQLGTDPKADAKRDKASAGDLRLSIGNFKGTPTAVLYRPVADKTKARTPKTFSSGTVKEYVVADVRVLTGAQIKVTKRGDSYLVEAAIPLGDIEFIPAAGQMLRGDFGVTYGDPAGQRTRLRNYWSNQHTGIVDDAVFELMPEPRHWGEIGFQ